MSQPVLPAMSEGMELGLVVTAVHVSEQDDCGAAWCEYRELCIGIPILLRLQPNESGRRRLADFARDIRTAERRRDCVECCRKCFSVIEEKMAVGTGVVSRVRMVGIEILYGASGAVVCLHRGNEFVLLEVCERFYVYCVKRVNGAMCGMLQTVVSDADGFVVDDCGEALLLDELGDEQIHYAVCSGSSVRVVVDGVERKLKLGDTYDGGGSTRKVGIVRMVATGVLRMYRLRLFMCIVAAVLWLVYMGVYQALKYARG